MNMNNKDLPKKNEKFTERLGDKIERAGEKISEKAPKVGGKVREWGDQIEHSRDGK